MLNRVKVLGALPVVATGLALAMSTPASAATATITATPATGLTNGQSITVTGTNFPASTQVYLLECSAPPSATACDTSKVLPVTTTAAGTFSTAFTVLTGAVGNGTCKAGGTCYLAASDAAQTAGGSTKIGFASAAVVPPKTTTTKTTTTTTKTTTPTTTNADSSGSGSVAPTSVSAGSGGGADRDGVPTSALLLGAVGATALTAGGLRLRRR